MAFTRVNPLGWALFEELTSAQMNQLDLNASRAIDGVFGGTYNLSAPITINGTMTVTNLNVGTLTGDGVFDTLTVNGIATFNDDAYFNDVLHVNGTMAIASNVTMTAGSFIFTSSGDVEIHGGTLRVFNTATASFEGDVYFSGGTINSTSTWNQNSGYLNMKAGSVLSVAGGCSFVSRPAFNDGLTIYTGKLVNYSTSKSWIVRCAWAQGAGHAPTGTRYEFDSGGYWIQSDSSSWPARLWCFPQGLWGGVAVKIIAAEFHARANGLSGTPSGDTQYRMFVTDEAFSSSTTATANDPSPNSSSDHYASWSGSIDYAPSTEILGFVFMGYRGGDTLNGSTKWYEVKSIRVTFSTNSMGYY